MERILGRPVAKALENVPEDGQVEVVETAAPVRKGAPRSEGNLRVLRRRGNTWVAARFLDGPPKGKEEP